MKAMFGLLSLVIVLAAMGVVVKKGLRSSEASLAAQTQRLPATHNQPSATGNVADQSRQLQQQYRQQIESAISAPRAEPDQAQ